MIYKIPTKSCPKCGEDVNGVTYIHGGDFEIDTEKSNRGGDLKRLCTACDYYWYEKSLDNQEKA